MKNKGILFYPILLVCFFFYFPIINTSAEEIIKEIDITTSPQKIFFDIKNGRPGDTYIEVLDVKNNGSKDFEYLFSNRFLTGSEKFYNELLLIISDQNSELYNGKLKDFEKFDSRILSSNTSENLTISVSIPLELNNEYQNLNSEFQFKFYVEGTLGGILPANAPKLPNTGSNMFDILVVGVVLVLTGFTFQFIVKRRSKIRNEL